MFDPVDAHVLSLLERTAVPKRDFLYRRLSLPYYAALEAADTGLHAGFPAPNPAKLKAALEHGDFALLELLLCQGVRPRLDALIAGVLERKAELKDLRALAEEFGVQEVTLWQWVIRDKLIAVKRGKKLYSHSSLRLEK